MTSAGTVTILHRFLDGTTANDGETPVAGLVEGSDDNFYGTTLEGGSADDGTVFRMTPTGMVTTLHSFNDGTVTNDGINPQAGLVEGSDGSFYGTTLQGGPPNTNAGTVFKITPTGTVTILHSFNDKTVTNDGDYSYASLVQGSDGSFYGTTSAGGVADEGTVFKITPTGTVTILHSFDDRTGTGDGDSPYAALIQGSDGNFYGTTLYGGFTVNGTVFRMTPAGTVTILHSFSDGTVANDGERPQTSLVQGSDGNLYGTTPIGGSTYMSPSNSGDGTVYRLLLPTITSFTPAFGPVGTVVTITGTNFTGTTKVRFHNANATYTVTSATQITCTVPTGAGTGTITVTAPSGAVTSSQVFTVKPPAPTITSFTPTSGPVGTVVTITGTNFTGTTKVRFHNANATYTVTSATQITCTVPSGAGTGTITVTTPSGAVTSAQTYTLTH